MIAPLLVLTAQAADKKPHILVIFGDGIGYWNVSAYNRGMMGYRTPNIDRIGKEGTIFTDHNAQQHPGAYAEVLRILKLHAR